MRSTSLRRISRVLVGVGLGIVLTGAFALAPVEASQLKRELVPCFNTNTGHVIWVPPQAAQHINGHGGWVCKGIAVPEEPKK